MPQFNIHVAKAHLSELVQRAMLGEEIIIAKDNKLIAKLTPLHLSQNQRHLGTAKGLFNIAPDFEAPLKDFEDHI